MMILSNKTYIQNSSYAISNRSKMIITTMKDKMLIIGGYLVRSLKEITCLQVSRLATLGKAATTTVLAL